MNVKVLPSVEYLRACFDYDPETGELRWRQRPPEHFATKNAWAVWNAKHAGDPAGSLHRGGYYYVSIAGADYKAHRVIFKLVTNDEPPATIDHHHGDPSNNRWDNLRPATWLEQAWNTRTRRNTRSGFRGVYLHCRGRRWCARITKNGIEHHLGCFATREEASAAFERAARELHGEFYRAPHKAETP